MKLIDMKKRLNKFIVSLGILGLTFTSTLASKAEAGLDLYDSGNKHFEAGALIQVLYNYQNPTIGESSDKLSLRRIRPYIAGSLHEDWLGKIQIEFAKNEIRFEDALILYKGLPSMEIALGNARFPFSREFLTAASLQQTVRRTFVGDGSYGSPFRNLGLHLTGDFSQKKFTYGASIASASIDPDDTALDFQSPVNGPSGDDDNWNQGVMIGGRIDWNPLGFLRKAQGDFERKILTSLGVAAYSWRNDGDNNTGGPDDPADVDSVNGYEISGAFRGKGFSVDGEFNLFDAETIDPTVDTGIYQNGKTGLTNWALKGGYMIIPSKLEVVTAYEGQDADGYAKRWTRSSLGLNWFIKKNDIKLQATYRLGDNLDGQDGNDKDELFIQAQFAF